MIVMSEPDRSPPGKRLGKERKMSDSRSEGRGGHGLLPMFLGCGLLLVSILVLSLVGPAWGLAIALVALLICPVLMLGLWHATDRSGGADSFGRQGHDRLE